MLLVESYLLLIGIKLNFKNVMFGEIIRIIIVTDKNV